MKRLPDRIDSIQYIVVDLFCGAGGSTTGFEDAIIPDHETNNGSFKLSKVVACVNHDPIAIKSHWANHPEVEHFEEDITTLYGVIKKGILLKTSNFERLIRLVNFYRTFYPNSKVILWASLECTNFSKAKGGKPRDADSRTLADHLSPYIIALDPDYIKIENVVEFMSWGPLDKNGRPISRKNGHDWNRWRKEVCKLGYRDEWKQLNAADFGALTSRNRLFGCFAKPGLPIVWPEPTHTKNPEKTSIVKPLKKWEPVKKALDFNDEGNSIFNRKKPLSTKTMQRLFMGCVKHIAGGKDKFLSRYYGGNPEYRNHSIEQPAGSLTTNNRFSIIKACFIDQRNGGDPSSKSTSVNDPARTLTKTGGNQQLVQAAFISKAYSGKPEDKSSSIESPAPTITTVPHESLVNATFISRYNGVNGGKHDNSHNIESPIGALGCGDNHAKITANFIDQQFSQGKQNQSVEEPLGSITTVPKSKLIQADFFIDKQYSGSDNHQSIEQPSGSILQNDKHSLIKAKLWVMNTNFNNIGSSIEDPSPVITADRHHHYLINPSWGGNPGSVDQPCPVVIARQDKAPLYLITCTEGPVMVPVYECDCEWTIKLKEFMALYGIADIKMRMLKVIELKIIQGFKPDYILHGTQTDQKKFIGNAVHKLVPEMWIIRMGIEALRMAA